jgi:hypothetical protein
MIYFATAREFNRVKIGYTAGSGKSRLPFLQTGCPTKVVIEAETEGGREVESALHQAFAPWRKQGEWFELSPVIELAMEFLREEPTFAPDPFGANGRSPSTSKRGRPTFLQEV